MGNSGYIAELLETRRPVCPEGITPRRYPRRTLR